MNLKKKNSDSPIAKILSLSVSHRNLAICIVSIFHFILLFSGSQQIERYDAPQTKKRISLSLNKTKRIQTLQVPNKKRRKKFVKKIKTLSKKGLIKEQKQIKRMQKAIQRITQLPFNFQHAPTKSLWPKAKVISTRKQEMGLKLDIDIPKKYKNVKQLKEKLLSFYNRLSQKYSNSLNEKLNQEIILDPNYSIPLNRKKDKVTYQAVYDKFGNIVKIKTRLPGRFKQHTKFLEESIQTIDLIPNPPELILNEDDEFVVNFTLLLNTL